MKTSDELWRRTESLLDDVTALRDEAPAGSPRRAALVRAEELLTAAAVVLSTCPSRWEADPRPAASVAGQAGA